MKPVQYFSQEYLQRCRKMTAGQILEFLENFRRLQEAKVRPVKSRLISIKIPEDLLSTFRNKTEREGILYQTQIKNLMKEYLRSGRKRGQATF